MASQNVTDPRLGPRTLALMAEGLAAPDAVEELAKTSEHMAFRQVLAIDAQGRTAIHSGTEVLGVWAEASGANVIAAGNLLANRDVPAALVTAFENTSGHLGDRLIAAMRAGLDAGGEAGPVHSAGMVICDTESWPLVDLRCDWTEDCPIAALETAWAVYKPQMQDYVQRALNPQAAPSYGVPGDE